MKSGFLLILSILVFLLFFIGASAKDKRFYETGQKLKPNSNLRQSTPLNYPLTYGSQNTGKITADFNNQGMFIDFYTPVDSQTNYLYSGDIWVGGIVGDDTLVSVGLGGWSFTQEFLTPLDDNYFLAPTVTNPDYISDNTLRAEFTDSIVVVWPIPIQQSDPIDGFHRPLNIKVAIRNHAWHSSPENNVIIYDVVITNIGNEPISECYFGGYFDFDIGSFRGYSYLDDLAGSLREKGIGYGIDNDGDIDDTLQTFPATKTLAFKFLDNSFKATDTNFNWWFSTSQSDSDYGPRQRGTPEHPFRDFGTGGTGTPLGDANKYYVMSHDEWDYDQFYTYVIGNNDPTWLEPPQGLAELLSVGVDSRFLMSLGPFELPPDSSVRVLFTTFTGDFVHTTSDDVNYLPYLPDIFYSLLYFNDVIANAAIADSLSQVLLDAHLPPLGLGLALRQDSTYDLQWDPWVYEDVEGFELYITETNLELLPHPGAVPPWWEPDLTQPTLSMGRTHRISIDTLDHDKYYSAAMAHRLGTGLSDLSAPINFKINARPTAPDIPASYAFSTLGGPAAVRWKSPDKSGIEHFNIYKFSDSTQASLAYHAVYDLGYRAQFVVPKDTFDINNKTYYYYSMEPYAVVSGDDTVYYDDNAAEGDVFLIASADEYGFESEFTSPIYAEVVAEMNRDVLLLTNSTAVTSVNFTYVDSIISFYERVMQGYDFEIYDYRDSTHPSRCPVQDESCIDWHDLMSFKMVIIDDRYSEGMFGIPFNEVSEHFVRYLAYGGKLVLFTRFRNYGYNDSNGLLEYYGIRNKFINDYLGVDSLAFGGEKYYYNNSSPPYLDTLFGFTAAISTDGTTPDVYVDTNRDPYRSRLRTYWTAITPPGVATFKLMNNAMPVQLFGSAYPDISIQQGHIVGLRNDFLDLNSSTYVFGYHLWNMDESHARNLILSLLFENAEILASQSNIFPHTYYAMQAHSIEPQITHITLGNILFGHSVDEIIVSSIRINGTLVPSSVEIVPNLPSYNGNALRMEIPLSELLITYGPVWGTLDTSYELTGFLTGGEQILATGDISIIGHMRGDFNVDGTLNIADLNWIVGYLFREQELPEYFNPETMDPDGAVDILDLTHLINYIFRSN